MSDKTLIDSIFEKVNLKVEEKKTPRKKRAMTAEQKEKAIENLRKGRETSLRNRKAKAAAKEALKKQGVPVQDPVPAPVQAPVQTPVQAPVQAPVQVQAQADVFEPEKQKKQVTYAEILSTSPPSMKEPPSIKVPPSMKVSIQVQEEEQDTGPHTVCTWGGGGGGLW